MVKTLSTTRRVIMFNFTAQVILAVIIWIFLIGVMIIDPLPTLTVVSIL